MAYNEQSEMNDSEDYLYEILQKILNQQLSLDKGMAELYSKLLSEVNRNSSQFSELRTRQSESLNRLNELLNNWQKNNNDSKRDIAETIAIFRGENRKLSEDIEKVQKSLTWQKNMGWYGIAVFYTLGLIIFFWWAVLLNGKENEVKEAKTIVKLAKAYIPSLDTNKFMQEVYFINKHDFAKRVYYHPDEYTDISIAELRDLRARIKYLKGKNRSAEVNKTDSVSH